MESKRQMMFNSSLALYWIFWTAAVLAQTGSRAKMSSSRVEMFRFSQSSTAALYVRSATLRGAERRPCEGAELRGLTRSF